jgi:hypothetical protein
MSIDASFLLGLRSFTTLLLWYLEFIVGEAIFFDVVAMHGHPYAWQRAPKRHCRREKLQKSLGKKKRFLSDCHGGVRGLHSRPRRGQNECKRFACPSISQGVSGCNISNFVRRFSIYVRY